MTTAMTKRHSQRLRPAKTIRVHLSIPTWNVTQPFLFSEKTVQMKNPVPVALSDRNTGFVKTSSIDYRLVFAPP